ncbi:MAG: carbamoyltransferase HypF, partial [Anaerolineae bacterium]
MTTRPGRRQRIRVTGVVQGVGFRPFVYGIALRFGLAGHVGNDSGGVFIEVEGPADNLNSFVEALRAEPPPLAHVERITVEEMQTRGDDDFVIVHSEAHPQRATLISPDLCTCDDCLRELTDPADRRYRYAFINCTNCGPRYTIIQDIPYDRPLTPMAAFPMCPTCQAEYDDPLDRRFHAQPNACPDCGPQIWLEEAGVRLAGDAIAAAQRSIAYGGIVAIKGLGGFHLACDAANDNAVARLRERKHRPAKPFALMAPSVQQVRTFAHLDPAEEAALTSRERPILLLRKHEPNTLSARIAPGNATIGVMLPYTPLHFLLVTDRPFVMTSGNISGEPIVTDNDDARLKLGSLADAFLMHNRAIHTPCDDSVIRRFQGVDLPVRRSRGYAPFPIRLPLAAPPLLATGGELKATFCLAEGEKAFMSQHIGDMANLSTLDAFTHAADHMARLFRIEPEAIITDSHPGYLSNRWAHEQSTSVVEVQHHHAHIAAVMAEHSHPNEPVIGFAFDGTGYGTDGTIWGGEVLIADYGTFERSAYLKPVPLSLGDVSVHRPYLLAIYHLYA